MQPNDIKQLIEANLQNAIAYVNSPDNVHFEAIVICSAFTGLTRVKQQQLVYQILQSYIASGELHALALKTYTPEAWKTLNAN